MGDASRCRSRIGRVSGKCPNSAVELEHMFEIKGSKIASLEIR